MNHRDLIFSSEKKPRFKFLMLPHDLQDQIIAELDSNRLSLPAASRLAAEHGYQISHNAFAKYLRALRAQRLCLIKASMMDKKEG